ncbi:threonine aldolase family protein [Psychroserpens luteus]|uniref:Threonine aldolase family protein n=1 Tax=Psychroserpens luteus TaxID=1434066 RepID=A0ABW5ZT72_9FLAO|nr:beta-eliminating lyase-related protein [Psychroserpens luteus]
MGNILLRIQDLNQHVVDQDTTNEKLEVSLNFTSDGLQLSPVSYAKLLVYLTQKQQFKADVYGLGTIVHNFEQKVAQVLGKEKAIYMPTGTMANHIAMRLHCSREQNAVVHEQSHMYRDCGNAISHLSGIPLIPISTTNFSFSAEHIEKIIKDASEDKITTQLGAIAIETPVRRNNLENVSFDTMRDISVFARKNDIALHLDGARIIGAAALSNKKVEDFTSLFDTVYLSLYKHFNSISGAILAGSKEQINDLHNERRMFGGGLRSCWENIIVADFFLTGFEERFAKAQEIGKTFLNLLSKHSNFSFEELENGTNVYKLCLDNENPIVFREKLLSKGIDFPEFNAKNNCFYIKINESILHFGIEKMIALFTNKD